jgi:hypothetical protein
MSRTSLRATAAVASVVTLGSLFGLAGPASANDDVYDSLPNGINCDRNLGVQSKVGPNIAVNWAGKAGCVGIETTATTVRVAWVVRNRGWQYVIVRNGGTTNDRVVIRFTHVATGTVLSFRYELGKTVISV